MRYGRFFAFRFPARGLVQCLILLVFLAPVLVAQVPQPTLLLIHGRNQPVDERREIEAEWQSAVNAGLSRAGHPNLVPESSRRFVWFADLLQPGVRGCSFLDSSSADTYKAAGASRWPTLRSFIAHAAESLNNSEQQALAQSLIKDVETYLQNGEAACAVDGRLRDAIGDGAAPQRLPPDAPVILVAHSLGSMVAYKNLMNRLADTHRPVYLITIGSMLGARVVQQTLLGSHAGYPAKVPLPVKGWWNIANTQDTLAFPAAPAFTSNTPSKRPKDFVVDLGGPDGHSVTRYLGSAEVGHAIADAWCAASPATAGCKSKTP